MSLGISFAGYRNGLPRTTSHNTTQPYGAGTVYPIGFTLSEMAEIFWRTREWTVDSNVDINVSSESYTSHGESEAADEFKSVLDATVATETRMIPNEWPPGSPGIRLSKNFRDSGIWNQDFGEPNPPTTGEVLQSVFLSLNYSSFQGTQFRFLDGLYWPYISVTIRNTGIGAGLNPSISSSSFPVMTPVVGSFFGKPLKFYSQASGITASGSVTIAPSKWWGYGGQFDTTTGARL